MPGGKALTKVKICGLMHRQDVELCTQAGADMLGFVVGYPQPVPWNLTVDKARKLIIDVPSDVDTCLVTGGTVAKILDLADKIRPAIIQLHYQETLNEIKELSWRLGLQGIKIIKALRVDEKGNCNFEINDPFLAAQALSDTGLSALLVDSYTVHRPGGTGMRVNTTVFTKIRRASSLPVILAGGLNPTNISPIVKETQPYAVDVLTGLEKAPGQKDPEKIIKFMAAVNV